MEAGRRYRIGRSSDCDLAFPDPAVSRHHATVFDDGLGNWTWVDNKSSTGSWLENSAIQEQVLSDGNIIQFGVQRLVFLHPQGIPTLMRLDCTKGTQTCDWNSSSPLLLGRDQRHSIRIGHPQCPRTLCQVKRASQGFSLEFSKPTLLQGRTAKKHRIDSNIPLDIPFGTLQVFEETVSFTEYPPGHSLSVEGLSLALAEKNILQDVSFEIRSGELLAIIGGSGQGKSTLLHCLAGDRKATAGTIAIHGMPPTETRIRESICFLQQDAPLHDLLTVEECIEDACHLFVQKDTNATERKRLIDSMLARVGLETSRTTLCSRLSGGEKRRAALAVALVASPGLILLDEPFAGLDPVKVGSLASWLRQIAWGGQTIILTTHEYSIVPHADKVLILHQGHLAFFGSPDQASQFFNVTEHQAILPKLESRTGEEWHGRFMRSRPGNPASRNTGALSTMPTERQAALPTILSRFYKGFWRDRGRLITTILQPVVIGIFLSLLFSGSSSMWVAAFALNLCANWFGMSGAIREIIQEKILAQQEFRQGTSPFQYLLGKWLGLFSLAFVQTFLCFMVLAWRVGLPVPGAVAQLYILGTLASTLAPAIAAGLAASLFAKSPGQANATLPLLLIPQIMFAGALVPLDQMHPVGATLARVLWSSWNQTALQQLFLSEAPFAWNIGLSLSFALGIVIICAWAARPTIPTAFLGNSTRNMK